MPTTEIHRYKYNINVQVPMYPPHNHSIQAPQTLTAHATIPIAHPCNPDLSSTPTNQENPVLSDRLVLIHACQGGDMIWDASEIE